MLGTVRNLTFSTGPRGSTSHRRAAGLETFRADVDWSGYRGEHRERCYMKSCHSNFGQYLIGGPLLPDSSPRAEIMKRTHQILILVPTLLALAGILAGQAMIERGIGSAGAGIMAAPSRNIH